MMWVMLDSVRSSLRSTFLLICHRKCEKKWSALPACRLLPYHLCLQMQEAVEAVLEAVTFMTRGLKLLSSDVSNSGRRFWRAALGKQGGNGMLKTGLHPVKTHQRFCEHVTLVRMVVPELIQLGLQCALGKSVIAQCLIAYSACAVAY